MDDRIREILSSPIEDKGRRRPPGEPRREAEGPTAVRGLGPWLLGAVMAGGALALIGYLVAGGDDATTPTSLAPSSTAATTTTTAPPQAGALPEGYTAAGVYGVRVERVLVRPDAVFVTVSSVLPNTLDIEASAGFEGGRWELELSDGEVIESLGQSFDGTAPGFVSVRFPIPPGGGGLGADDFAAVRLTGIGLRTFDELAATAEVLVTPGETASIALRPSRFTLDEGVMLEFSDLAASLDRISLEWVLGGEGDAVASVAALLEMTAGGQTISIGPDGQGGGFGFFFPSHASQPAERDGSFAFAGPAALDLTGAEDGPVVVSLAFQVSLSWTVYAPANVELPLDGVLVAEAG